MRIEGEAAWKEGHRHHPNGTLFRMMLKLALAAPDQPGLMAARRLDPARHPIQFNKAGRRFERRTLPKNRDARTIPIPFKDEIAMVIAKPIDLVLIEHCARDRRYAKL